ncbi:DUF4832 domain-containing protein [Cesiribacter sp. SM1]|uniref:DUF4832 domain-containing protein n=1 Tax=Cesiribacter sp. SM1 TaxID=2861196 RepID=UPI001CD346C9|nr:DUF4832 domain-containing protein [Cesiribacter sp. SM1]
MRQPFALTLLMFATTLFSCTGADPAPTREEAAILYYEESQEDFPNPERGFYHYSQTTAGNYSPLSEYTLKSYRTSKTVSGATYDVVSTLVFRYFILDAFKSSPLSQDFIDKVNSDFTTARAAGVKLIPRFTYTVNATAGNCSEGFICPPYGDAPKGTVIEHINQLKPVFEANADIIACIQMGFIGTWGENYYTDYFGDASTNDQGKLLDQNWQDRIDVLKALLDAAPKDIMVQVRYPQIKQRLVYGIDAPASSPALTPDEAFTEEDKARIGYHNDCLLASSNDFGTYEDYGNSSSPRRNANTTLRNYFSEDSKYVVVGGETCSDGYSPQNDCEPAGKAEQELSEMHYTYLNTAYNNEVNNDWVTGGCMESIKRKLGYRLILREGTYSSQISRSEKLEVNLQLENIGYASPYNQRPVNLILRNISDATEHTLQFQTDIRHWFTGEVQVEQEFSVANIPSGEYELFLQLPDKYSSIANRPEYSIRLANENTWEETTGYNKLDHILTID